MLVEPPDPPLRTGDILLRLFHPEDAYAVASACADPLIPRFTFMEEGLTEQQAMEWIERVNERWRNGHPRFAIVDAESERLLGQIGMSIFDGYVSAEAYYWVAAPERRRRIASTSLGLVADWAFDALDIERLFLLTMVDNEASGRVAMACGFVREGVLRSYERVKGSRPDVVSWSLLPEDPRPWRR